MDLGNGLDDLAILRIHNKKGLAVVATHQQMPERTEREAATVATRSRICLLNRDLLGSAFVYLEDREHPLTLPLHRNKEALEFGYPQRLF